MEEDICEKEHEEPKIWTSYKTKYISINHGLLKHFSSRILILKIEAMIRRKCCLDPRNYLNILYLMFSVWNTKNSQFWPSMIEACCSYFNLCYETPENYTFSHQHLNRYRVYILKNATSTVNCPAEQGILAVNCRRVSFLANSRVEITIISMILVCILHNQLPGLT